MGRCRGEGHRFPVVHYFYTDGIATDYLKVSEPGQSFLLSYSNFLANGVSV